MYLQSSKVLELSSDATKHKLVFFSAEMALLLVLLNRKRDCKDVCVSVSNYLEKISRGLKDGEVRDEQRKLGAIFVEALQETVAQSRNLALGQSKLIGTAHEVSSPRASANFLVSRRCVAQLFEELRKLR